MSDKQPTARCIKIGKYIKENSATIRKTAEMFNIGKSTVYKDVTDKLKKCDQDLFDEVREILKKNKAERHIRGGEATKRKYLQASSDRNIEK